MKEKVLKEKNYEVSLRVYKEIKMVIPAKSQDEALQSVEDLVLKGDYEKLFTKEQTKNYVQVKSLQKKPLFCKKRSGFVFLKKWW